MTLILNICAFGVGVFTVIAAREIIDRFFNFYSWDRAIGYGVCGGLGVWAILGVYCAPLLLS